MAFQNQLNLKNEARLFSVGNTAEIIEFGKQFFSFVPNEKILARFLSKIEFPRELWKCWNWRGEMKKSGYGRFYIFLDGYKNAHKRSYEWNSNDFTSGDTDHLCRNRACVNPAHLQRISHRENILRGQGIPAINARKKECIRGHPLTGNNLNFYRNRRWRRCRACTSRQNKAYRLENGAAMREQQQVYRQKNRATIKERNRAYYLKNWTAIRKRQKKYWLKYKKRKNAFTKST